MTPEKFIELKTLSGLTWGQIALELGVCIRTVYNYRSGETKMRKPARKRMMELGR